MKREPEPDFQNEEEWRADCIRRGFTPLCYELKPGESAAFEVKGVTEQGQIVVEPIDKPE